jgi:CPA2 family monovalent cation:H+ antiporter-2
MIPDSLNGIVLGAVLVSIVANPALLRAMPSLRRAAERLPWFRFEVPVEEEMPAEAELTQHTVILGGGRTGGEIMHALLLRNLKVLVVEHDPRVVADLRVRGVPVIYGDASNPAILDHCRLERARVLAVTIPDAAVARAAVAYARRVNPRIDVVIRAAQPVARESLREVGAAEVVAPEFEAGLEFVRHTLHRYGVSTLEIQAFLARRRIDYYRGEE